MSLNFNNNTQILFRMNPPGYEYDPKEIAQTMERTRKRNLPKLGLTQSNRFANKTAFIIGGGPSLNDDVGGKTRLQQMDENQDISIVKVLAGSAHRMRDQGKLKNGAHISVYNMPGAGSADTIATPYNDMEYWLASQCAPEMFHKLGTNADIRVWEPYIPEIDYNGINDPVIGAGSTAPTAAVALLLTQGCKRFEFFGVDGGNFGIAPNEYAAYNMDDILARPDLQEELANNVLVKLSDGRTLTVAANFWNQAQEMKNLINAAPECEFIFHGDSLNHLLFNKGLTAEIVYDPTKNRTPQRNTKNP